MCSNRFYKEVLEQPQALTDTLFYYKEGVGKIELDAIATLWNTGKFDKVLFTGMGSSYFISSAAAMIFSNAGISAFAVNASEFLHNMTNINLENYLIVLISQSGESYEIVKLAERYRFKNNVVCITNEGDSFLARHSAHVLLSIAGREYMTSTKTFISSYIVVCLLRNTLVNVNTDEVEFRDVISDVHSILESSQLDDSINSLFVNRHYIQMLARGKEYAVAAQSALMFMEMLKKPASAMLAGEFRHGPLEMVCGDFLSVYFSNSLANTYKQDINLVIDILKFGGRVLLITNKPSRIQNANLVELIVECNSCDLFPVVSIIPIQLLLNYLAKENGILPGDFVHGLKVTKKE